MQTRSCGTTRFSSASPSTDRSYKLTSDLFLPLPYGIGIKQGNTALKAWVNSRLNLMKKRDLFIPILKNTVPPAQVVPFSKNILRPKQGFGYTQGDVTTAVPVAAHTGLESTERPRTARPLLTSPR